MASNNNLSNNFSDEELKKIQEEKEKLLREIKGDYGSASPSDTAESKEGSQETATASDSINDILEKTNNTVNSAASETIQAVSDSMDDLDNEVTPINKNTSMPKYGSGFKFVPIISIATVVFIILGHIIPFNIGVSHSAPLRYTYIGFGVLFAVLGLFIFVESISSADILTNAQMGKLVTTGIYSKTRNPMYGGVIFLCAGALFCSGNIYMYVIPLIYWWLLGVMMKSTEEPMLFKKFGDDYKEYYLNTNRFVPIKKK